MATQLTDKVLWEVDEQANVVGYQVGRQKGNLASVSAAGNTATLADATRPNGGLGTLIVDWTSSLSGTASTADVLPESGVGGAVAQLLSTQTSTYAAANAGSQSSAMNQVGFWARSNTRASGQKAAVCYVEFGTDNTFANNCFFAASIVCDGKWRFYTSPAQVAWGTSGTFTIGTTAFTHVRLRESASLCTSTGRTAMTASDGIQFGRVFRDPCAKPFAIVRLDDGLVDQYVARQTFSTPFVGASGVTIASGAPQSALSLIQAFGLKGNCHILTRHVGDTASGFLTVAQLRDLQDTYGWCIGFQSHFNPLSSDNRGVRLLGPDGYTAMPVGQISAVNTGTGVVTSATHNITTTSGAAGLQGYPVTLIGQDFPVPTNGFAFAAGDTVWLRNVAATTFKMYRSEADSCNDTNALTFSSAGTPANWGYRYRNSANDTTGIALDFSTGQALMQGWGFTGWRHYAPNQGAFDSNSEAVLLSLRAAGNLLVSVGTYASTGIAKIDYTPRLANAVVGTGPGAGGGQFGTTLTQWMTVPSAIDTHGGGVDIQTTVRAYVDDCVKRGAICANYHHHFSNEASMRNFAAYLDQVKLRVDQGVMQTGTVADLYTRLNNAGLA